MPQLVTVSIDSSTFKRASCIATYTPVLINIYVCAPTKTNNTKTYIITAIGTVSGDSVQKAVPANSKERY